MQRSHTQEGFKMSRRTTFKLDERYFAGMSLAIEKRQANGYGKVSKAEIVRIALEDLFRKWNITDVDIRGRLAEDKQPSLLKTLKT